MNNFKKVNDLDVGTLKTLPVDLKKLSDIVSKEVVKKTVYDKLNTKVNNLENKQNLKKKIGDVENKITDVSGLVTTAVLNIKIAAAEYKMPDTSGLVTTAFLTTKIGEIEN